MNDNRLTNTTRSLAEKSRDGLGRLASIYNPRTWKEKGLLWSLGVLIFTYLVITVVLGVIWSGTPGAFDVRQNAVDMSDGTGELVTGYPTTAATIRVADTLLSKPGGFIRNDISLPGLYLDNMPNWEQGTLDAVRDMARAMRNDFSRSQSQSREDPDLIDAQTLFNNDSDKWIFPSAESKYSEGVDAMTRYLKRLADANDQDGQFFTRADNLSNYLREVEKRLGGYVQTLGASVGETRFNTSLAGDPTAEQSTPTPGQQRVETPWLEIDDNFYRARGYTWALLHILRGIELDFEAVLKDKNALVSLSQIIRELEGSQQTMWSPMILNGTGFGPLANHSLVLASYVSRANAALIDLRDLLRQG